MSSYVFTITNAGILAAINAQQGGPKITITSAKFGSAVGYTPSVEDTALRGTIVHTAGIYDYRVVSSNMVDYAIRLDQTVGDFSFGEIGLYLEDGTLFALTSLATVQQKIKIGTSPGNIISFLARLIMTNLAPIISFTLQSLENAKLLEINSVDALPLATDPTTPNAYIITSGDDAGAACLALKNTAEGIWSFTSHRVKKVASGVVSASTLSSLTSPQISNLLVGSVQAGRYIMQLRTGTRKSYCRYVTTSSSNVVTFNALPTAPAVGDLFDIYVSDHYLVLQLAASDPLPLIVALS